MCQAHNVTSFILRARAAYIVTSPSGVVQVATEERTSFVKQTVLQVRKQLATDGTRVIDVWLNLARPMKPTELMHHIVRGFYDRMRELKILSQVTKEFHDDLVLAYQRTSYTIARERSDVREQSIGSESMLDPRFLKFGISASRKRSLAQKQKLTLLGYDDKAAEHDVMRMFNRIQNNTNTFRTPSALDRYLGLNNNSRHLKIIVILDELDKLEDFEGKGKSVIDDMLSSLKNIFTTSGVVFLFVAGRSMQERWIEEVGQGDSLYESIFASNLYLPCIWEETQDVLSRLIVFPESQQDELYRGFESYLRFHGRGIPRRIVRELNHHVAVNNNTSYLAFDDIDLKRLEFYAQLQNILDANRVFDWNITLSNIQEQIEDKKRLALYYLLDWILQQTGKQFTIADVVAASLELKSQVSLAQDAGVSLIERLLTALLKHGYICEVEPAASDLQIQDLAAHRKVKYQLTSKVTDWLKEITPLLDNKTSSQVSRSLLSIPGYEILELVGKGGMGAVYRAIDLKTRQQVAVKVLLSDLSSDPNASERFEREIRILRHLRHPDIIRLLGNGTVEGRPYIVMEYVDGINLEQLLEVENPLKVEVAIHIGLKIASAFDYIHDQGIVRGDIKPSNVLVEKSGRVYVTDLGIAKVADAKGPTREGVIIGTPAYMSPEQVAGAKISGKSDIYSLGILLYEMITGSPPFEGSTSTVIYKHVNETPVPPSDKLHTVPNVLDDVILRALEKNPDHRFQSMREFTQALPTPKPVNLATLIKNTLDHMGQVESEQRVEIKANQRAATYRVKPQADKRAPTRVFSSNQGVPSSVSEHESFINRLSQYSRSESRTQLIYQQDSDISAISLDDKHSFKIGRSASNDVVINDLSVSREHAIIRFERESYIIYDLAASTGTYINGRRAYRQKLAHKDVVTIGKTSLLFVSKRTTQSLHEIV